jgi:microsomal dipeptidase-like Zn-dependent dipeptidase
MTDPSSDLSSDALFDKALDIAEKHLKRAIEEGGVIGPYVAVAMIEAAVNAAVDETSHEDVVDMLRDLASQVEEDADNVDD